MRYLVVDDELHARQNLIRKLSDISSDLVLVGEASNVDEAATLLENQPVDLLFLDIEMPGADGFSLLDRFPSPTFYVIFVTAYNEFVLRALDYFTIGYITKPIDTSALSNAVQKAIELRNVSEQKIAETIESIRSTKVTTVVIPSSKGLEVIASHNVILMEAEDGYTKIRMVGEAYKVSTKRLKEYETMLAENGFVRVHRSFLINIDHLVSFSKQGIILLSDGSQIMINKNKRKAVREQLQQVLSKKQDE